ncbi:phosphatase PAP2/dual specificity phosphatase family protein [Phyllobacterium pellucidum]|uniref:phosphatase PAP2/dual specificity phosphatase family protein n=1 Tax=Phyllobacterium pellucidum TaxID=2740464 RepID=UPI001D14A5FB|nr:phosphatase PAP2/dual specificity phosphatase family protein [Phyllobacterium sp. T1018]UGY09806.1 phosphatase PAP2/dual specificity phosphatase family protein [Phyllobacterium sp. T1018]
MKAASVSPIGKWRLEGPVAKRAILWLAFLAPFFYLTYGTANWLAAQRLHVAHITFSWEQEIPFLAWTIFPYWSINAFYGLSLFLNDTPSEVDRLARRYLTAQMIAVACFVAFPLTFTFAKPLTSGAPGFLFDLLGGFDKPFNQAPSLHIALLIIIWEHWRHRLAGAILWLWHLWCLLIGVSVLTTYQHHFIDIPTGALLGFFALWLFPAGERSPLGDFVLSPNGKHKRIGSYYAAASLALLLLVVVEAARSIIYLILLWPALAFGIVALAYLGAGPGVFQKRQNGTVSLASLWLLAPYRLGVKINIYLWTRKLPSSVRILDNVHLGRLPKRAELSAFASVIDLTSELARPSGVEIAWRTFPALDLVPVPPADLEKASEAIENAQMKGPVLVCCALGFQRSAAAVASWLVSHGHAVNAEQAIHLIKTGGRPIHLSDEMIVTEETGERHG